MNCQFFFSSGIRLFEDDHFDSTDAMEALALQHNQQHIDIYSCSWGPEDNGWTMDGPGQLTKDQFTEGTRTVQSKHSLLFRNSRNLMRRIQV